MSFKKVTLIGFFLALSIFGYATEVDKKSQKEAAEALIKRTVPEIADVFVVEIVESKERDYFELESKGEKIILRGTNGVSVASALNYYLKNYANCHITWHSSNLNFPSPLPKVEVKVVKDTPYKYRYYFNYCTFNYSMSWWNWERWQKEIDFMALNGINMPLALTGQNSIWDRVYKRLGFTDEDLSTFFSGPAYFNWFWMGNLDGWGGPLPQSFMEKHEDLQKQILERERSLGMKPILPAFTGHVPPTFKDKFPEAKLRKTQWVDYPEVYVLDPQDEMFETIGTDFMKEMIATFGTDHYYSSDTFNENKPPTNDSLYLNDISAKIYKNMTNADPKATWVMQGWIFVYSGRDFWGPTQTQALLNAVPDDRMIILDLWAECRPAWEKKESFYGKQWVWCMLNNFGGNNLMYGRMDEIANGPSNTLNNPKSGNMVGLGMTAEAIEQNPVIYELLLDNVWRREPIEINKWLKGYITRRYGKYSEDLNKAWQALYKTVYSGGLEHGGPTASIIAGRPTFNKDNNWTETHKPYDTKDLIPAWDLMIKSQKEYKNNDGFKYDLVDVSRQVLANYADTVQRLFVKAYLDKDFVTYKKRSNEFIEIIQDMDALLATRKEFLLGTWVNSAKSWATNKDEELLYEKNAKNLITTWGPKDSKIHDYSWRLWSGMLNSFYKKRWEMFFLELDKAKAKNIAPDLPAIDEKVKEWEWNWVNTSMPFSDKPVGNEISESLKISNKYFNRISTFYNADKN